MRITHCLLSCDSNPSYLEFWPVVANAWLKFGIQPVLFYIATDKSRVPDEVGDCPVHVFDPLPDIPLKIQASTLRYWGCRHYPEDIVIASDMDAIPLSKKFFIDRLREIDDTSYVHIPASPRSDGYGVVVSPDVHRGYPLDTVKYLQACYHIGRGDTINRVWEFSDSWEDSCRKMVPYWYRIDKSCEPIPYEKQMKLIKQHHTPCRGDEVYPSLKVALAQHQERERIELLSYSNAQFDWICRGYSAAGYNMPDFDEGKLRSGYYSAVHCPRPYSQYREAIDRLLNLGAAPHLSA